MEPFKVLPLWERCVQRCCIASGPAFVEFQIRAHVLYKPIEGKWQPTLPPNYFYLVFCASCLGERYQSFTCFSIPCLAGQQKMHAAPALNSEPHGKSNVTRSIFIFRAKLVCANNSYCFSLVFDFRLHFQFGTSAGRVVIEAVVHLACVNSKPIKCETNGELKKLSLWVVGKSILEITFNYVQLSCAHRFCLNETLILLTTLNLKCNFENS